MTYRETLLEAMHLPDETLHKINEHGAVIANLDTMSQAIHDVYCGIIADHDHPNDKDRDQARAVLAALQGKTA